MCHDLKIDDHNIFNFVIQMDNEELFLDDLLTQNDEEIKRLKDKLSRALKVERLLVSLNSVRLGRYNFGVVEDGNYDMFQRLIKSEDESYETTPVSFEMFITRDFYVDVNYHSIKSQYNFDFTTQDGLKNCEQLQILLDELYQEDSSFLVRLKATDFMFVGYIITKS